MKKRRSGLQENIRRRRKNRKTILFNESVFTCYNNEEQKNREYQHIHTQYIHTYSLLSLKLNFHLMVLIKMNFEGNIQAYAPV